MSNKPNIYSGRLLPTYRWDEWDNRNPDSHQLSNLEGKLRLSTANVLRDFITVSEHAGEPVLPPESIISPIISMNVRKRSSATRKAEELIEKGELTIPPASLIPTFMNSGHEIPGVEDSYMQNNHPSQELFAYNRLNKLSWLNRRFGAHCLRAIGFAHPHGAVEPSEPNTRVKAHASSLEVDTASEGWIIVSSKTSIASIYENDRRASLISRVTGAVDITSPLLTHDETEAILELSEWDETNNLPIESSTMMAQKALLLDALSRHDGSESNPFRPVIQTVYLTQQPQL